MGPTPNRSEWLSGRVVACHAGDPCSSPAQGMRGHEREGTKESERAREMDRERKRE